MTGSEMQEVVRIVTDSVMAAVERRISSLGVSVRPATVTQESPLMVRLDGAKTPAPARVSGELSVGSRVLVLSSGTTLSVIGGSDGGDVEVSDLADGFVLPVSKGGTGVTRSTSNSVHKSAVPIVGGDGVMEVGQYIDMHYGDNATDYDLRISVGSSGSPSFSKPVPVSSGGTGATSGTAALGNLGIKAWLLANVFKVGFVWVSYTSTSPASIVGGTWTAITGRFPYFNAGTGTGGASSHTHGLGAGYVYAESNHGQLEYRYKEGLPLWYAQWRMGDYNASYGSNNGSHGGAMTLGGSTDGGSNLPPYQTLYAWRRTA